MASNRFISNILPILQESNLTPIFGYDDSPILTLEEAVEKIIPVVSDVMCYVATAKQECNKDSSLLTWDESAAIYLYTMPKTFFSSLNTTLRSENRQALKPWFNFLKLLITALKKLPSTKGTVWRGVKHDASLDFVNDGVYTWWDVKSCSKEISSVQPFLGESGTLFAIEAINGKDISMFSAISGEHEVILMPGTRVRARGQSLNFICRLFVIHLDEIDLQCKPQVESNDLWERIKHEYRQHSTIERFMNPSKSFPIEKTYINLAIVKIEDQHEKEKQLRNAQHATDIMGTYEEIYATKTTIDAKNIFEQCKSNEKQLLVFGRAGIGKSTFCRYIAYQWATGSYWPQYELLVLIPLRRLTVHRYPSGKSYSLLDLVKKEIFSFDLSEKEEKLLNDHFDAKKTLWILDGYDEIAQDPPPHLQDLFDKLLRTPHHIVTSRPYLNTLSYNVQMEITGFTDKNIENYIKNFFDQMKNELDNATIKSEKLLKFLTSNPSMWGVAHIPVNLELICSLYSNEQMLETDQLTMTQLYTMMIEWLCRRYLKAQGIAIQKITKGRIYQHCQKELIFLESLAFEAMKKSTVVIRPILLEKAMDETNVCLDDHPNILNIGVLKSLNEKGTGTQIEAEKDHYFVHLSFQEYFAARYLINALQGSQPEKVIEFIKHQKYHQRYTLMFSFAAGLLNEKDPKLCLNLFWNTIQGEPLDLVGIRHIQLLISCMEETTAESIIPRRSELIESIADCIKYSFTKRNKIIREHLLRSLQRAQLIISDSNIINMLTDLLQDHDVEIKSEVLSFIDALKISSPSHALIISVTARLDDDEPHVIKNACETLENMGEKAATDEVITKLLNALRDRNDWVRDSASIALGKMREKAATDEVITKLVCALADESDHVRSWACQALGSLGEKAATDEVITKLVCALEDESDDVRSCVCQALGEMGEKAATNEVIINLISSQRNSFFDISRSVSAALNKIVEKAVTNEIVTKLINKSSYKSDCARRFDCETVRNMEDKVTMNKGISSLLSTLGDKRHLVENYIFAALENLAEKMVTSEMILNLVSALHDDSMVVKIFACVVLGKLGEKAMTNEALTMLVGALDDEDEYVRSFACVALGNMGIKAATNGVITKLVNILGDKSADVRGAACIALGKISQEAATAEMVTKLVSSLGDKSVWVRGAACIALGEMSAKAVTDEVITQLICALEDESDNVRRCAMEALGTMSEKAETYEVITKLVSALKDESDDVKRTGCAVLKKVVGKIVTNEVVMGLTNNFDCESDWTRRFSCEIVGHMNKKITMNEVITKLMNAEVDDSYYIKNNVLYALEKLSEKIATNEAIPNLASALQGENTWVRIFACQALGKMGEKAATDEVITKLVCALVDENDHVRSCAYHALGKMGEKAATDEVITKLVCALEDESDYVRNSACQALGNLGEKAATDKVITKLVSALEHESDYVRNSACQALGNLGEKAATSEVITKLVCALEDESNDVRSRACKALGKMGEKAATNEVISKVGDIVINDSNSYRWEAASVIGNILISSTVLAQIDPRVIEGLCRSSYASRCLKNISIEDLIMAFATTKNSDWLPGVTEFALLRGVGMTATEDKVVVFSQKNSSEIAIRSPHLGHQLIEALISQAKLFHLYFKV